MDRNLALEIKEHGLKAVIELTSALNCCGERCSPEEFEIIKRAVGISIGRLDLELLGFVYAQYPDLDDLKDIDASTSRRIKFTAEKELKTHPHPAWQDRSDYLLQVPIEHEGDNEFFEQLSTRRVGEKRHEVCCIPFFIYDLALGDIVEVHEANSGRADNFTTIEPSGHETYWVWIDDNCPISELERIRGKLAEHEIEHEGFGFKLLAIDLPLTTSSDILDEIFAESVAKGLLKYNSSRERPT